MSASILSWVVVGGKFSAYWLVPIWLNGDSPSWRSHARLVSCPATRALFAGSFLVASLLTGTRQTLGFNTHLRQHTSPPSFAKTSPFFGQVAVLLWLHYRIPVCVHSPLGSVSRLYIAQYHSALTLTGSPPPGATRLLFGCFMPVTTIYDMQHLITW